MNIVFHDELEPVSPYPGLTRLLVMDRKYGSGAITQGMVTVDVGGVVRPHTHLVEESVTVLDGDVRILRGDERIEVRGRRLTFVAPANVVHGLRNIGDRPVLLCVAYPSVEVGMSFVDVEV
ncbi:MAG: cupin domain-containing protein [Chloroflexi bacterium]|nr:cupin domain-containing protein [Chloroflexota bacterium]